MKRIGRKIYPWSFIFVALLLVGCGGASTGAASTSSIGPVALQNNASSQSVTSQGHAPAKFMPSNSSSSSGGPPYLIKTLAVTMQVKDTRRVADDLQAWISATDPHATSEGMNYQQVDANSYNITLSFSVQTTLYPQIQRYLRDYSAQHQGQLLGFQETVQDVTSDYVDTQSRLKNLRGEQERLLSLLSNTQSLGDVLAVEQRLTDVEGQIEQTEEHVNDLNNQLQFYTITITLQPSSVSVVPPVPPAWSIGQTFHDAFASSLAFAQGLLSLLIWLLAFAVYIVPLCVIGWFGYRWRKHLRLIPSSTPKV